ncbi:hypothetical protein [Herbidospora sp. RD11066]
MRHSWIGQPLTVLALVVLVVNDHLLKFTWPGVVTGKLSDVAGLIVAPAVLDLLLRRPAVSIAVTGVGFTLVKATETGAWLASEAWSLVWGPSLILADLTDLLTLPALWLAWWASRHPVPVGKTVVLLLIPAAVLAITATSPEQPVVPPIAYATEVRDGAIIVLTTQGTSEWTTRDGTSWQRWTGAVRDTPTTFSCVVYHCFRIVPGRLKVEESRDGGAWTTAWELSPHVQDRLLRAYPPEWHEDVQPVESLSISAIPGLVVVANGADGVVVRNSAGTWRRLGLGYFGPSPTLTVAENTPGRWEADLSDKALLIAIAAGLLALVVAVRNLAFTFGAALAWPAAWAWLAPRQYFGDLFMQPDSREILVCALAFPPLSLGLFIAGAVMAKPPPWIWGAGALTTVITWLVVLAPFEAWSIGWVPAYDQAEVLAIVLGAVVAAGAAFVTARYGAPPRRSPDHSPDH